MSQMQTIASFLLFASYFFLALSPNWTELTACSKKFILSSQVNVLAINPLTPNDLYISRTAPLTSKRCILYIYSANIGTEYFKHALYSPFFLFKMQFVS